MADAAAADAGARPCLRAFQMFASSAQLARGQVLELGKLRHGKKQTAHKGLSTSQRRGQATKATSLVTEPMVSPPARGR